MAYKEVFAQNLRRLMQQLCISNAQLSRAIGVDPSLVSRWRRQGCHGRNASLYAISIAQYISDKYLSPENCAWLTAELTTVALGDTAPQTARIALWLNPDADISALLKEEHFANLQILNSFRGAATSERTTGSLAVSPESTQNTPLFHVGSGNAQILDLLNQELAQLAPHAMLDLYLSSEIIAFATDPYLLLLLQQAAADKQLQMRILVQSANNSAACSKLVSAYMPLLVGGNLQLTMIQGTPQTFTTTMHILLDDSCAFTITETAQHRSSPVATLIREPAILADLRENYSRTLRYARPMMTAYDDSFARNIIEAFYEEYGVPGSLDVIKCGLNPMFMSIDCYAKVLRDFGHHDEQYDWRYQEFCRFKQAMDEVLRDSRFREVLSLSYLRQIAETGCCKMPSMYFMDAGVWYLKAEDCVDVLDGYIRYLEQCDNFEVVLLEDESLFLPNSCWHIKNNRHVMIHSWDLENPMMVYSDQLLLIDEFQRHFEHMWSQVNKNGNSKRGTIDMLRLIRDHCAGQATA